MYKYDSVLSLKQERLYVSSAHMHACARECKPMCMSEYVCTHVGVQVCVVCLCCVCVCCM